MAVIGDSAIHSTLLELMRMYEQEEKNLNAEAQGTGDFIPMPRFGITLVGAQLELFVQQHYTDQQRFALKLQYPVLQRALK